MPVVTRQSQSQQDIIMWSVTRPTSVKRESTPGITCHVVHIRKIQKRWTPLSLLNVKLTLWWSFEGSSEKAEPLNNAKISSKASDLGPGEGRAHKVRFDTEDERSVGGGGRRLRGRNIFAHSDVEVGSSVAASVVSDNTHLYRRSRSAVSVESSSILLCCADFFHGQFCSVLVSTDADETQIKIWFVHWLFDDEELWCLV